MQVILTHGGRAPERGPKGTRLQLTTKIRTKLWASNGEPWGCFHPKIIAIGRLPAICGRAAASGSSARAQPNPLDPNTDLTCGQLWTFFSDFGLLVDAGCVTIVQR